jgi:UPF0755 protein
MGQKNLKYLFGLLLIPVIFSSILVYAVMLGKGVHVKGEKSIILIPEQATYDQVLDTICSGLKIKNISLMKWVAKKKRYPELLIPGMFVFEKDLSYNALINTLRSGKQVSVNVTFNNIRTIYQLAEKVGKQIEADSAQIASFLDDPKNYDDDGFTREDVISVFIPNTYQFYWSTNARRFYKRMLKEYNDFWNEDRLEKAKEKNLTPVQVSILASIIDDEVAKPDEKPRIAGVYLNRLKRGIPLQACPTIKYALNDFTITRILTKYLTVDSPYNTYKHKGFPPGPIGCPTIEGIDAVLNAENHNYLYFAAKSDFSGYHNFSRTLAEHNHYAAEYQRELNKRRIFR